jgi:hypothetical protein
LVGLGMRTAVGLIGVCICYLFDSFSPMFL